MHAYNLLLDGETVAAFARDRLDDFKELACLYESPFWGAVRLILRVTDKSDSGSHTGLNSGSPGGFGAPPKREAKSKTSVDVPKWVSKIRDVRQFSRTLENLPLKERVVGNVGNAWKFLAEGNKGQFNHTGSNMNTLC